MSLVTDLECRRFWFGVKFLTLILMSNLGWLNEQIRVLILANPILRGYCEGKF